MNRIGVIKNIVNGEFPVYAGNTSYRVVKDKFHSYLIVHDNGYTEPLVNPLTGCLNESYFFLMIGTCKVVIGSSPDLRIDNGAFVAIKENGLEKGFMSLDDALEWAKGECQCLQ